MDGKSVAHIWPEIFGDIIPLLSNIYKTGKPFQATNTEVKIDRGKGLESAWFSFSFLPFLGQESDVTGILAWSFETTQYVIAKKEVEDAKDQLHAERTLLQTIFDGIPVMITIYDPQFQEFRVNRAFERITGWTHEDTRGKDLMELVYPDNDYRLKIADYMKSLSTGFKDFQMRSKNGKIIESSWANIKLSDGRQVGIGIDITERKKIEGTLQKQTAQLDAILNSIPDGYVVYNNKGEILRLNAFAQDVLSYTKEQLLLPFKQRLKLLNSKKPDGKTFPIECFPSMCALRGETVRNNIIKITRSSIEYWLSVSASPIIYDGQTTGAIMEFADITELHNLQEQLTDERNFVNAVLQTSGALILVIDTNGQVERFNKACEQLTGYTADEFSGHSVFELIPNDELEKVRKIAERMFSGESIVEYENHWLTKSGEKRFIRWKNSALFNDRGQVAFIIATGIDITDRKKLEDELTVTNTDLESFSYSVSHDLKGPIGIIGGFTTALIEDYADCLGDDGRDYLQRIDENVKKTQQLIDTLLSLSRVVKKELKKESVNLSVLVATYLKELCSKQPERKTEFSIQENVFANADQHLIQIALENLLRNAWKFTSRREVTRIWFGNVLRDGINTFFIRDNGVGFDTKFARSIFEPFKRVHSTKEFSGTGVGLSIVQRVINRHGGSVWAEGEVSKGAVVFFTL